MAGMAASRETQEAGHVASEATAGIRTATAFNMQARLPSP